MAYLGQSTVGHVVVSGTTGFAFEQDSADIITNSSTGNYSMSSTANNSLIVHTAGGNATYQLPSASARFNFMFIHRGSTPSTPALNEMRIQPASGDNLYFNNQLVENAGYLSVFKRGMAIKVYTIDATSWIVENVIYPEHYKNDDRNDAQKFFSLVGRDTWSTKATAGTSGRNVGGLSLNGYGYKVSGTDSGGNVITEVVQYRDSADTWTSKTGVNTARATRGMSMNGFGYCVGGETDIAIVANVEQYNDNTNTWTNKTSLGTATRENGVCSLNGYGYSAGGRNAAATRITTVQRYSDNADTWTSVSGLATAQDFVTGVTSNGYIYTQLSEDSGGAINTTSQYNDSADAWLIRTALGSTRSEGYGFYNNGYVYMASGFSGANTGATDEYNDILNTWTSKTAGLARRVPGGFGLQGYGYIHNGLGNSGTVNTNEQYN